MTSASEICQIYCVIGNASQYLQLYASREPFIDRHWLSVCLYVCVSESLTSCNVRLILLVMVCFSGINGTLCYWLVQTIHFIPRKSRKRDQWGVKSCCCCFFFVFVVVFTSMKKIPRLPTFGHINISLARLLKSLIKKRLISLNACAVGQQTRSIAISQSVNCNRGVQRTAWLIISGLPIKLDKLRGSFTTRLLWFAAELELSLAIQSGMNKHYLNW